MVTVACIASGCAIEVDSTIDLVFDPCATGVFAVEPVTDRELESIDHALAIWNEAAGLALERVEEGPSANAIEIAFVPTIAALRGVYDDEVGTIMINRNIVADEERALTIAHELGHAFGLHHVSADERASLMNPGVVTVPPTDEDVRELVKIWGDCGRSGSANEWPETLLHNGS